jgi:outer membrane murein-binding lipoprotein Lpp
MTRFMALVLGVTLLTGCIGPTYSANPMIVGASTDAKRQSSTLYRLCMEARGWTAEAPQ